MINELISGMIRSTPDHYMFDRVPSVYGQQYILYWRKGSYLIELYKDSDAPENLLEKFYPIEVENIIEKYYLDTTILENYLKYHLSLSAYVPKEYRGEICELVGRPYYISFEERMVQFQNNLKKAIDKVIVKNKLNIVE